MRAFAQILPDRAAYIALQITVHFFRHLLTRTYLDTPRVRLIIIECPQFHYTEERLPVPRLKSPSALENNDTRASLCRADATIRRARVKTNTPWGVSAKKERIIAGASFPFCDLESPW